MSVYTKPNSPYWQYDFWIDGHRFHGTLADEAGRPLATTERKRRAQEREAVLKAETRKQLRAGNEKARITLDEALGRYWLEHGQYLPSAGNIWSYAENWRRIGRQKRQKHPIPILKKTLDKITDDDIAWFVSVRRGDTIGNAKPKRLEDGSTVQPPRVSKRTVNADVEFLRAVYGRARDAWNVEVGTPPNWSVHILEMPDPKTRALSLEEDQAVFEAIAKLRPDFADFCEFAILSGWRLSEIIKLEKPRIDRQGMMARVIVKGGEERSRPLSSEMLAIIERNWMFHPTRVFTYVCQRNRSWKGKDGQKRIQRKGQRYPFTKGGWRKEFAAVLSEAGQEVLAHQDPSTSDRYIHAAGEFERSSLEAASALRRAKKT